MLNRKHSKVPVSVIIIGNTVIFSVFSDSRSSSQDTFNDNRVVNML